MASPGTETGSTLSKSTRKLVLFLGTENRCRGRFAEICFNSVAAKMGLAWHATSRGLVVNHDLKREAPIDPAALGALQALGMHGHESTKRPPACVSPADLEQADRIVAMSQAEHSSLLQQHFPSLATKVEYWQIPSGGSAFALIEQEVMDLIARILGGGQRVASIPHATPQKTTAPKPKPPTAKVGRETAGRRGKGVTTIFDLPLNEERLKDLAATLKARCGTGGTVKNGRIEIQGDQRERIVAELEKLGYAVKRVGG
jgi:translation initiation factor 1